MPKDSGLADCAARSAMFRSGIDRYASGFASPRRRFADEKSLPNRNRTSDHSITTGFYSRTLYQLSYGEIRE